MVVLFFEWLWWWIGFLCCGFRWFFVMVKWLNKYFSLGNSKIKSFL